MRSLQCGGRRTEQVGHGTRATRRQPHDGGRVARRVLDVGCSCRHRFRASAGRTAVGIAAVGSHVAPRPPRRGSGLRPPGGAARQHRHAGGPGCPWSHHAAGRRQRAGRLRPRRGARGHGGGRDCFPRRVLRTQPAAGGTGAQPRSTRHALRHACACLAGRPLPPRGRACAAGARGVQPGKESGHRPRRPRPGGGPQRFSGRDRRRPHRVDTARTDHRSPCWGTAFRPSRHQGDTVGMPER